MYSPFLKRDTHTHARTHARNAFYNLPPGDSALLQRLTNVPTKYQLPASYGF